MTVIAILIIWFLLSGMSIRAMSRRHCPRCGTRMDRTEKTVICRRCIRFEKRVWGHDF